MSRIAEELTYETFQFYCYFDAYSVRITYDVVYKTRLTFPYHSIPNTRQAVVKYNIRLCLRKGGLSQTTSEHI